MRQWKGGGISVLLCVLLMVADGHGEQGRILRVDGNISDSVLTRTTERVDPLEHFKKYNGGFNITNKNYWSSTIFTGKFGYIIAVAWLIIGLIYSTVLTISYISFYIEGRNENEIAICFKSYNWSLLIAALFTFLAIVASAVALKGSIGFHSRAVAIENLAVEATNNASGTINTVTESVEILRNDTQLSKNIEGSSTLQLTTKKLNDEASNIQMKAERIMHKVTNGSNILNAVTIITVTLNLLVIILLLASVPFKLRQIFRLLVILCWLLTVLLWAYFGLYYFFANFAGDTCIALDEYWRSPGNSTLNKIVPCHGHGSAETILHDVGEQIYDLIQQVNSKITSLKLSLSELEYICNPFSGPPDFHYHPENCSGTIRVGDIPKVIQRFACLGSSSGACKPGEFIPASIYGKLRLYTGSMQDILDSYPGMKSLVDCQLLKDAFSIVLFNHCKPLNRYVLMAWASLAVLSTISMLLLLLYASAHQKISKATFESY